MKSHFFLKKIGGKGQFLLNILFGIWNWLLEHN